MKSRFSQCAITWETSLLPLRVKHATQCLPLGDHSDYVHIKLWQQVWVLESDNLHLNPALSCIYRAVLEKLYNKLTKPQVPHLKVRI